MTKHDELIFGKKTGLSKSLNIMVEELLMKHKQLHDSDEKGELGHVYLSFLMSSVLCKLPWIRIDFYDENDRADIVDCFLDWDVSCVSEQLYSDADIIAEQRELTEEYELEQIWLELADEYFEAFKRHLPEIISECKAAKDIECSWHFGQYLGNAETVWSGRSDEVF